MSLYGKRYLVQGDSRERNPRHLPQQLTDYAFPFSSFPKYEVHLSLRASLLKNKELFLHLLEQNHKSDPSFLMNIMPVPAGNSLPQNEHFLGLGISDLSG
jgi:hypothetical protein